MERPLLPAFKFSDESFRSTVIASLPIISFAGSVLFVEVPCFSSFCLSADTFRQNVFVVIAMSNMIIPIFFMMQKFKIVVLFRGETERWSEKLRKRLCFFYRGIELQDLRTEIDRFKHSVSIFLFIESHFPSEQFIKS